MIATKELVKLLFKKRSKIDRSESAYPIRDGYDAFYAWVVLTLEQNNDRMLDLLNGVDEKEFISLWDNLIYEEDTYSLEEQQIFEKYINELLTIYWRENKGNIHAPALRDCEEAYKYFRASNNSTKDPIFSSVGKLYFMKLWRNAIINYCVNGLIDVRNKGLKDIF